MRRAGQVIARPGQWFRGRALSAENLNEINGAIDSLSAQANAGGQNISSVRGLPLVARQAVVSSLPTFDDQAPSLVNLVNHPDFVGQPAEEFAAAGFFDLWPSARDGFTYTYTDINTRTADDQTDQITEELTPRVIVGGVVLVASVTLTDRDDGPPITYNDITIDVHWAPGQMWASETILGAGLGP